MTSIINWLIGVNDDNKDLFDALKDSTVKSRRVIGRGTLTVDPIEIKNTPSFKRDIEKAEQIVRLSRQ